MKKFILLPPYKTFLITIFSYNKLFYPSLQQTKRIKDCRVTPRTVVRQLDLIASVSEAIFFLFYYNYFRL